MPWENPEIDTDEDVVTDRILDGLADRMPGWEPVEGAPEVALAEELGREIALLNQATIDVLELAIAGIGETAFGFPAYLGVTADIEVDLDVTGDTVLIPAGFTVVGINDNGDEVAFALAEDVVSNGITAHVTMTATDEGDIGNAVPAGDLTIVTATTSVVSATATSASSNGADPETIDDYLGRLVDYLGTLRPGGVNADDLAALARSVPGVYRAMAVDLYDPADPDTQTERCVTVFPVSEDNGPVSGPIAAQVQATLEEAREVNFIVHVASPTFSAVEIVYEAVAETGQDPEVVRAGINGALADWLGAFGSTANDPQVWNPVSTVRLLELARIAGGATGVAYLASLTINGTAADLELDGIAPLPAPLDDDTAPSTIEGTVS
jgi:hypothetical protein